MKPNHVGLLVRYTFLLLIGMVLVTADTCGISDQDREHSIVLKVRGYNLEGTAGSIKWSQVQDTFLSTLNRVVTGNQSTYSVRCTVVYVEDLGLNDLSVVVFATIIQVGYLPPDQLKKSCVQGYLTLVRLADVYYYPDEVTIGVTSTCDPSVVVENTEEDFFNWEFTIIVAGVSGFCILISIVIFISVRSSKRRRRKEATLRRVQLENLSQSIAKPNTYRTVGLRPQSPPVPEVAIRMVPTAFVVDDLDPDSHQEAFHETTLHTKL